ncbi:MAG: hypothetical protein CM1200mP10_09170 [Candidatus Neomarinimicrobiota bacterium]|nr:MAG: hypothetical protein CM1200mP10_09170 [Candidatus Neomarinimicrobiota bacterium]
MLYLYLPLNQIKKIAAITLLKAFNLWQSYRRKNKIIKKMTIPEPNSSLMDYGLAQTQIEMMN